MADISETLSVSCKPFLRWAGGKSWLLKEISYFLPKEFNNYHEPFIGGGSVYLYLKNQGKIKNYSFLSDVNEDLINAYNIVKNSPSELSDILETYVNEKEFYYLIRSQKPTDKILRAAQFIYLNRTSFNGIYRVNLKGEYNVPYGYKSYKQLFDFNNIMNVSKLFKNARFFKSDFEETLPNIKERDLVFLDPPYTVAHENNGFIKYNQKIFAWEDQIRLKNLIEQIKCRKAYFILTNAYHKNIKELFINSGEIFELKRHSVIGGKSAKRKQISEYIITNGVK